MADADQLAGIPLFASLGVPDLRQVAAWCRSLT